jgi:hypothetical protein
VPIPCPCSMNSILISHSQPDKLETPTCIPHLLNGTDPIKELGIALFEIKDIPGCW